MHCISFAAIFSFEGPHQSWKELLSELWFEKGLIEIALGLAWCHGFIYLLNLSDSPIVCHMYLTCISHICIVY